MVSFIFLLIRYLKRKYSTKIKFFFSTFIFQNGKSKVVQAETKTFYLDVGENDRGVFVRISEVWGK